MDLTPLCACRLFQDLPEEFLRQEILPRGTLRAFEKQAVLLSPGDQVDWFAVLLRGRVQITQLFSDGTSSLMDALGPAYVLGADLACTRSRRAPYFAIAVTAAQLLQIPAALVLEPGVLPEPERQLLSRRLLTLLADGNLRKHYRLAILSQRGIRFQVPFSREEMAAFLCVNRSALSHELSRMEAEGLIAFRKQEFILLPAGARRSTWSLPE